MGSVVSFWEQVPVAPLFGTPLAISLAGPVSAEEVYPSEAAEIPPVFSGLIAQDRIGEAPLAALRFASDPPRLSAPKSVGSAPPVTSKPVLRPFVRDFIDEVERLTPLGGQRWLGFIAPMQTGKSKSIGPLIDRVGHKFERVLVMTASDIATQQIHADLAARDPSRTTGRIDATHKDLLDVTVASVWTLVHVLQEVPSDKPTLVVLDEAFHLQCQTLRKILTRLGVAEPNPENPRKIVPATTDSLLVALSGTAAGLDPNCHVAGRLDMLDAIDQKWIRHTHGQRVFPKEIKTESKQVDSHEEIWWEATPENAWRLACEYRNHVAGKYRKNLIYAPTIKHAELLNEALQKICPEENFNLLHSRQSQKEQDAAYVGFECGGSLISVRKITRSYRAEDCGAVFHTFQSSSMEYFSQTTGRGWGQSDVGDRPPLFVLEACWDHRPVFSNLARLFGLTDYPDGDRILSDELIRRARQKQIRDEMDAGVLSEITAGRAHRLFADMPVARAWREAFREFVAQVTPHLIDPQSHQTSEDALEKLAKHTGLDVRFTSAYAQGALPIRIMHIHALWHFLEREEFGPGLSHDRLHQLLLNLLYTAHSSWAGAVAELRLNGIITDAITKGLRGWVDGEYTEFAAKQSRGEVTVAALLHSTRALEDVLRHHFHLPRDQHKPSGEERAAIARLTPHVALLQRIWDFYQDRQEKPAGDEPPAIVIVRGPLKLPITLRKPLRRALERGTFRMQHEYFEAARFFMGFLMNLLQDKTASAHHPQAQLLLEDLECTLFELRGWPVVATSPLEKLRLITRRTHVRLYAHSLHIPSRWSLLKRWGSDREILDFIAENPQQKLTPQLLKHIERYLQAVQDPQIEYAEALQAVRSLHTK